MRGIEAIARKVLNVMLQNHQNEKPIDKKPKIREAKHTKPQRREKRNTISQPTRENRAAEEENYNDDGYHIEDISSDRVADSGHGTDGYHWIDDHYYQS